MTKSVKQRAVVFDLDETIGNFLQFHIFLSCIEEHIGHKLSIKQQQSVLDLYPKIFRPGIMKAFQYLKNKQRKNVKVIIYSNNNGAKEWISMIKKYIEDKVGGKLFNKIMTGYLDDETGAVKEISRTTPYKTYDDLVKAAKLTKDCKILFFDDAHHPHMYHKQIKYILLKKYEVNLPINFFIDPFLDSKIGNKLITNRRAFISSTKQRYKKYQFRNIKYNYNEELKYSISTILNPLKQFMKTANYTRKRTHRRKRNNKSSRKYK